MVQVIYLSARPAHGGGLVLFGIGGGTTAVCSTPSTATEEREPPASTRFFKKRLATYEQRIKVNPQDAAGPISGWPSCTPRTHLTGENFNQTQGA